MSWGEPAPYLIAQGKLVGETRAHLANSGAGLAVRRGAPKPDIGTVDAFKRALLRFLAGREAAAVLEAKGLRRAQSSA